MVHCGTHAGRVVGPGRTQRTSTDNDDVTTSSMLDEVGVKPITTPPSNNLVSSSSPAALSAEQAATIKVKREVEFDQSTSTCDKVGSYLQQ